MSAKQVGESESGSKFEASAARGIVAGFASVIALTIALNLYVNPFAVYWSKRYSRAQANVRVLKYELIRKMAPPPETVILGSSRVFTVEPKEVEKYLPGKAFNFSMPAASAEDYYAAIRLLVEDAKLPIKNVIVGIDHSAFNPAIPTLAEARYFPGFAKYFVRSKEIQPGLAERIELLISMEQTEESLHVLQRSYIGTEGGGGLTPGPDGMVNLAERDKAIADGKYDLGKMLAQRVRKYPERSLNLSEFKEVDPLRLAYLDDFLVYCKKHNIKVHAFITPYHPALWKLLYEFPEAEILGKVDAVLKSRFAQDGIELMNFSDINNFDGDPNEFYDEIHVRRANARTELRALFADEVKQS